MRFPLLLIYLLFLIPTMPKIIIFGTTKTQLIRSSKGKRIVMITTATACRRFMPLASFITLTVRKKLKNPLIKRDPINERSRYVAISCFVRSSPAISISPIGFPVAVAINSIINVTAKTAKRHKHDLFIVEKFFIVITLKILYQFILKKSRRQNAHLKV